MRSMFERFHWLQTKAGTALCLKLSIQKLLIKKLIIPRKLDSSWLKMNTSLFPSLSFYVAFAFIVPSRLFYIYIVCTRFQPDENMVLCFANWNAVAMFVFQIDGRK